MGVPKFYRWISERYPCLSEVVKESSIPEFDHLYLDMNGIIHNCSHPNDDDPHFRLKEKSVFFMAVDGVAPRAKMNQQRGRRFRTSREAASNVKRAIDKGEKLPSELPFDSNCITPGTRFMNELQGQLEYFVASKISTDPLWRGVKIILSGHNSPGEGEHKIMDFIRFEKSKEGYDPNTRHCLYGLDADLIMLEVKFGGRKNQNSKIVSANKVNFHLLHLSLLREYIDLEFSMDNFREKLPFKYDLESIIDDWILMGFLVGNDFVPHLPHLHINKNALSELYSIYKQVLLTLDGYINENGVLNLKRFEKFMAAMGEMELARFDEIYSDMKWIEGKTARKNNKGQHTVLPTPGPGNVSELLEGNNIDELKTLDGNNMDNDDLKQLLKSTDSYLEDDSQSSNSLDEFKDELEEADGRDHLYYIEFRQHKREYYMNKMRMISVTKEALNQVAQDYVRAIQWILHYYFHGCISWSWYYNHHYTPWITDIKNFSSMNYNFDLQSKPFKPFEQLLAVLPPPSGNLLPEVLRTLMTSENSPILDFYPNDFECDLNGKHQDWEAVVLLPFIDEIRLLQAMEPLLAYLRPAEVCKAPMYFPTIDLCYASITEIKREEWYVPYNKLNLGLMKSVKLNVYFPGFPTLQHLPHTARIHCTGVCVFETPSIENSCIISLNKNSDKPDLNSICEQYLGKTIWVSWPHMKEALVVGETHIVLFASVVTGRKYMYGPHGKVAWLKHGIRPHSHLLFKRLKNGYIRTCFLTALFPYTKRHFSEEFLLVLFFLMLPMVVWQQFLEKKKGKIEVECNVPKEPNFQTGYAAARRLNISSLFLSRIMGSMYILRGERSEPLNRTSKVNVGLNLKFSKRNEETVGFTRKCLESNTWYYSDKAIKLFEDYRRKFPEVIAFLSSSSRSTDDLFYVQDLFPETDENYSCPRLDELKSWISSIPSANLPRRSCGSDTLDETLVLELEKVIESQRSDRMKILKLEIPPKLLYKPSFELGTSDPDPKNTNFILFDRIINVREGFSVPLGARGTLIGIVKQNKTSVFSYEVLFDQPFRGGVSIRSSPGRSFVLPSYAMIKISLNKLVSNDSHGNPKKEEKPFSWFKNQRDEPNNSHLFHQRQEKVEESKALPDTNNDSVRKSKIQNTKPPNQICIPPDPIHLPRNPAALFKSKNKNKNSEPIESVNIAKLKISCDSTVEPIAQNDDAISPSVISFFKSCSYETCEKKNLPSSNQKTVYSDTKNVDVHEAGTNGQKESDSNVCKELIPDNPFGFNDNQVKTNFNDESTKKSTRKPRLGIGIKFDLTE
ncbi:5'-3' exoribonuclease 2,5'-3' exoribonuclease 1,5'-3' exoribonuclease 2 homolog [Lepeophtheirus salmonis]|uniref:5'-3' exoribonuclease 1 n=1 Tax=Lepeophtheirus salmonis TaxID=72036 RepID=A0A7R8D5S9_LEPSM|nr:5'-3' exoribonuclease 2,5'-3' exoribonuclease 1,5'-3' exoribonuclease 2 homolog [Lepeophtheirus salmonis]CAF3034597.1 5'-3' exoribonuclease 2,5'-3' exoribonuclease 1,5'-3' exoribonuclease 2 homolog [Lepeophtheirus salmonis]